MSEIKHQKPRCFYGTFTRKGQNQEVSHYCPGCGHGVAHTLIAEAIDALGVQDRVVFCSPVGCSVFAYYYFDVGNVQCAHGRAPAVATAIRRSLRDAIVISYQGDGDLAGIGLSNIVHAANRGENISVFFINNAVYGMTGGQMAPTTLLNQQTLTTPRGRNAANDGYPIRMVEMINTLEAPAYIERVSLADGPRVIKARRAIRKALQYQTEGRGFSFVEILSPCPINWKKTPVEARQWIINELEKTFPVSNLRDIPEKEKTPPPGKIAPTVPSEEQILKMFKIGEEETKASAPPKNIQDQGIKIAGFGGQGLLSAGTLLANCAIEEGLNTTWLPSYGPEMRGGTANASVNISRDIIGSPIIAHPNVLVALNIPSLDAFEDNVEPGGIIFVNSSLINRKVKRTDVKAVYVPASDMAAKIGVPAVANVIIMTIYAKMSGVFSTETLAKLIPKSLKNKKNLLDANLQAIEAGKNFYEENCRGEI